MLRSGFAHFGDDTSGFASGLQELLAQFAPRRLRLHIYGTPHPFGYGGRVRQIPLQRTVRIVAQVFSRSDRLVGLSANVMRVLQVLAIAIRHRGVLLGSGKGITASSWELRIYRALGLRVITVLHGSDARPVFLNGARLHQLGVSQRLLVKHRLQLEMCYRVSRWSDDIVAYPAIAHYFGRRLVDRDLLGWPRAIESTSRRRLAPPDGEPRSGPVRILHAPSNPAIKGSDIIIDIVAALQRQGVSVELLQLTGVSNAQVAEAIRKCDFAIDQLWADVPGAVFALEVAQSGKKVVVGSAHAEWLQERYGSSLPTGIILAEPESVPKLVEALVDEAAQSRRDEHPREGYPEALDVTKGAWTSERALARRWVELLQNRLVDGYRFGPCAIEPMFFGFAPEEVIRSAASLFCETFSVEPPFHCESHRIAFARWISGQQAGM